VGVGWRDSTLDSSSQIALTSPSCNVQKDIYAKNRVTISVVYAVLPNTTNIPTLLSRDVDVQTLQRQVLRLPAMTIVAKMRHR
jgi:hypothetical protein